MDFFLLHLVAMHVPVSAHVSCIFNICFCFFLYTFCQSVRHARIIYPCASAHMYLCLVFFYSPGTTLCTLLCLAKLFALFCLESLLSFFFYLFCCLLSYSAGHWSLSKLHSHVCVCVRVCVCVNKDCFHVDAFS